jgi:hypothetical protein
MTAFDFCDTTQPCGKRDTTTVAPQALALLNNDFVHQQSEAMATRVAREAGQTRRSQIQLIFQLALGRHPTIAEVQWSVDHLARQEAHFAERQGRITESEQVAVASATSGEHRDDEPPAARRCTDLALASLCHVLLNTNEFIYVE